jgi:hypothetical protein
VRGSRKATPCDFFAHFAGECGKLEIGGLTVEASVIILASYISWRCECESVVGDGDEMQGGMTLDWKSGGVSAVTAASFVRES